MAQKPEQVLRGEAKWKAAKKQVADRNQAAHIVARGERDEREAKAAAFRRSAEREANDRMPKPPQH